VAPIVINDKCSDWFINSFESKYMLNNFSILNNQKAHIPAVSHIDRTSRIQTVSKNDGALYDVLYAFYKKTGIPILCNTSLNDKGEPIIETIDQAINFALRKGIKVIYINGNRIELKNHDQYKIRTPLDRNRSLFVKYDTEIMRHIVNPYGVEDKEYGIYKNNANFKGYNLKDEHDVLEFKRAMKIIKHFYDSKCFAY